MEGMDMNNILGQVEKIKNSLNQLQKELATFTVQASDENNIVTAVVNGQGDIIDYEFNPDKMDVLEIKELKKAIVEASNLGLKKAKNLEKEKKQEIIGDVDIPDMPGLF